MNRIRHFSYLLLLIGLGQPQDTFARPVDQIEHLIVIYEENWSFDSLYGNFPGANGLANAGETVKQMDRTGQPYKVLPVCDPCAFMPPDLPSIPFDLSKYLAPNGKTRDLIHEFYREQYQINGGKMNRFVAFSDAVGLTMSWFDATDMPEGKLAREFVLCDNFFHSAFGGSFLNHFFLISARAPVWPNAPADALPKLDADGYVTNKPNVNFLRFAVNTTHSTYQPHSPKFDAAHLLPPQTFPTIGDRLNEKGVAWVWYSGGWNDAIAGHPDATFQFHHQPFAYFKTYGDGTPGRAEHLKDEQEFHAALKGGNLPAVCFVKPVGLENEHPGYADLVTGQQHVADLVHEIQASSVWPKCAIIVTYDENGGRWDHVAPPKRDMWGPGSRVPTIIISPFAKKGFVDHTLYETISILRLIELRWGLEPLNQRDAQADPLSNVFEFGK